MNTSLKSDGSRLSPIMTRSDQTLPEVISEAIQYNQVFALSGWVYIAFHGNIFVVTKHLQSKKLRIAVVQLAKYQIKQSLLNQALKIAVEMTDELQKLDQLEIGPDYYEGAQIAVDLYEVSRGIKSPLTLTPAAFYRLKSTESIQVSFSEYEAAKMMVRTYEARELIRQNARIVWADAK
jgi:hypothetical protein